MGKGVSADADRAGGPSDPSPQTVSAVPALIADAVRRLFGKQAAERPSRPTPTLPRSALELLRELPETQVYFEADDALYNYESPFYRYCASGFPLIFADPDYRAEFDAKRRRLERVRREAWRAAQVATARRIEARRVETRNAVPCEAREPDPKGRAQTPNPSSPKD